MCSGYLKRDGLVPSWSQIAIPFRFPPELLLAPLVDVWPGSEQPVIVNDAAHSTKTMRWGFVPARTRAVAKPIHCARAETLFSKSFWKAAKRSRCVVFTSGYYEWSGPERRKLCHLFASPDRELIALAAVFDPDTLTFGTLTCAASAKAALIHERMPVVLTTAEAMKRWLAPGFISEADVIDLLVPPPDDDFTITPPTPKEDPQQSLW